MAMSCSHIKAVDLDTAVTIAHDALSQKYPFQITYLRTLKDDRQGRYLVEYSSTDILSSVWIGSVVIDETTSDVLDVFSETRLYSGRGVNEVIFSRSLSNHPIENSYGVFEVIDPKPYIFETSEEPK